MESEVLKEVYGSILSAIDEGQSRLSFGDVWIDEDENCVVIQHGDEEYKLVISRT